MPDARASRSLSCNVETGVTRSPDAVKANRNEAQEKEVKSARLRTRGKWTAMAGIEKTRGRKGSWRRTVDKVLEPSQLVASFAERAMLGSWLMLL